MVLESSMLVIGLLAALLIGMAKGGMSGGLATLVVPILSLSMDPRSAAALTLPILIISDMFAVYAFRGKWHTGHLLVLFAGAVIGIGIGTVTFHWVSEPMMRLLMGVISVGFVVSRMIGVHAAVTEPQPVAVGPGLFWGALSGFTSFTAHAGAPPVQIYLMPKGLDKMAFQGTVTGLFTAINLAKVPSYLALGQFTQPIMMTALMLMPVAAVGVFLGFRLQGMIPEKPFFRILLALLFITGVKLIWDGARGMGWI